MQEQIAKSDTTLYQKALWLKQAAEGISWLHGSNIIHGDLKPSNLLYHAKTHSLKIADFGVRSMKDNIFGVELGQTLLYTAPEVVDSKVSKGGDVYSFGLIIYFFITGKHPKKGESPEFPKDETICPASLRKLASDCLENSESKRPSFEKILPTMDNIILHW